MDTLIHQTLLDVKSNNHTDIRISEVLFSPAWDLERTTKFMQNIWVPFAYKLTVAYLCIVYFGQKWMSTRRAVDNGTMNVVLALWNFGFSFFSGYAAWCLLPELLHIIERRGFIGSYCDNANYYTDPITGFWGWMFVMSKAPELGDTLFLILRKRPVIFLHWYHHALTFIYATITYAERQAWCRWSLALNLTVHTVMYFYFGLQALKIKTPRPFAKFITTIQILQFVISCYIFVQLLRIKSANNINCDASWNVLTLGALMYLSYLYLFGQFFYNAYISPKDKDYKTRIIDTNISNGSLKNGTNNLINKKEEENVNIDEMKYLNQIKEIMENGVLKSDRTGTGTISIFGMQARYNLRNGVIPLLTTKRVFWKGIVEELLWFIRGETNSKTLSDRGVKIWDANGSRQFLDSIGHFERPEGDLGPIYGFQWRHFGAEYRGMNENYKNEGIDQLSQVIKQVKEEPDSRRIIMCSWNVKDVPQMALPPCHLLCQFYVNNGELSCQLYQRSGDMGLGVPFNIASYSLLTHMIAHVTGLKAGEFIHTLGDAHIYSTHIEALKTQLQRKPRPFPKIRFELPEGKEILNIEDFTPESIIIEEYNPYGPLKMQMAL